MRALVAGGAGFVGSHLCERLVADGFEVICIDDLSTGARANLHALLGHARFRFVEHDIVEPLPVLPRPDVVYHLASPASRIAYQDRPIETLRVNSEGTRRLLELAAADGATFFLASTSEVYGDPLEHPQRESYRGNVSSVGPRSMYDEGKRFAEAMTVAYGESRGVDVRIARIFNTYGPRMDPADGRVVVSFITDALAGRPLRIFGDGSQTRSFQFVDDLVEGIVRLVRSTHTQPVNLGNPSERTVLELAQLVRDLVDPSLPLTFEPVPGDDPRMRRPDISLANSILGWTPRVDIEEGLRRTIADHCARAAAPEGFTAAEVPVAEAPAAASAAR